MALERGWYTMQYGGTLIAVRDMEKARAFYETLLGQKVEMDLGTHVSFASGFSLQSNYEELVGVKLEQRDRENNFQLYFEVEDIFAWRDTLKSNPEIEFLHDVRPYPWGQNVLRVYDPDQHIVEISESMTSVAKRFLQQGNTMEQTAETMMMSVELLAQLLA